MTLYPRNSLKEHLMNSVSPEALMSVDGVKVHHNTANTMEAAKFDIRRVLGGDASLALK